MRLVLFTFPFAIAIGYLLRGQLRHLGNVQFRYGWAGLAGVVLQFLPVEGTPGYLLLSASFVLLLFVAGANIRLTGFALVLAGLWLNFLVIVVNEGMPVARQAIISSDQAETLEDIQAANTNKHHLATDDTDLLFLGDVIGIPSPVRQAISVGDVVAYAGAMWFVVAGMRPPREREADLRVAEASV